MTLVIAGPTLAEQVADAMRLGPAFEWTWKILQWPLVFVARRDGASRCVYYFAPDAEQDWVWITPGSVLATMLWVVISLGFKFYVSQLRQLQRDLRRHRRRHGADAVVLPVGDRDPVGAELNAEIEHASPYGKDVGEKVPGEKKKIGAAPQRDYEERRAKGEHRRAALPEGVNCDLDRPTPKP